jgi:hypothetical protein
MSYEAQISRANPSCFIFLIDQSASMSEEIAGQAGTSKKQVVADALNRLLTELILRCAREEGVRDYFHVAVIGYGSHRAESAFKGQLAGQDLVPISEVAEHPLRVDKRTRKEPDGAGGIVELKTDFPVWMEPYSNGSTPMCQALGKARDLVQDWVDRHPRSYPPITLNLTDGEANDGNPAVNAGELRALGTDDGDALLFNLHVSGTAIAPIAFPERSKGLPDEFARSLFGMSSPLPPQALAYAEKVGYSVGENARGFVYNADIVSVVQFLNIGSHFDVTAR